MKVKKVLAVTMVTHEDTSYVRVSPDNWFFVCPCGCKKNWYLMPACGEMEEIWQSTIEGNNEASERV